MDICNDLMKGKLGICTSSMCCLKFGVIFWFIWKTLIEISYPCSWKLVCMIVWRCLNWKENYRYTYLCCLKLAQVYSDSRRILLRAAVDTKEIFCKITNSLMNVSYERSKQYWSSFHFIPEWQLSAGIHQCRG